MKTYFSAIGLSLVLSAMVSQAYAADVVESGDAGRKWLPTVHFSYLDMILPGKFGVALAYEQSESAQSAQWELEYTRGSFTPFFVDDIGKFTEERVSLIERRGTSIGASGFNWFYGVFYQRFKLDIGNALLNRLTTYYPSANLLSISGVGGMIGFGYRWFANERFMIGVDAIAYSQPIFTLSRENQFIDVATDQNDRQKVETAITVMQYMPRLAIAKIALGYSF